MSNEEEEQHIASVEVDGKLVSLTALQQAANGYAHVASISIQVVSDQRWCLTVLAPGNSAWNIVRSVQARANDLTIQHQINDQTRQVRDALVKAALWESLPRQIP
jgi:hypothetical protein